MKRKCKKCGRTKELVEFVKDSVNGLNGFRHVCKVCWNLKWGPIAKKRNRRNYHEKETCREKAKEKAKKYYLRNKGKRTEINRKYNRSHRLECNARAKTKRAIVSGKLIRQVCEKCGEVKTHAHHEDYSQPFEVNWLCSAHHGERHRILNRAI